MATAEFSLSSFPYSLNTDKLRIGIAIAEWNNEITYALRDGAVSALKDFGFSEDQIILLNVPGAFELPHASQLLFQHSYCHAVIAIGCVVRGDTPHFEYVSQAATDGILRVGLDFEKPCIFGVLTTNTMEQAKERAGGSLGNKGAEAALAACWMLAAKQHLNSLNQR